jgi:hypothetical protein
LSYKKRIKTCLENDRDTVRFAEGDGLFRGGYGAVCTGNDGQPGSYGRLSRRNLTILKAKFHSQFSKQIYQPIFKANLTANFQSKFNSQFSKQI